MTLIEQVVMELSRLLNGKNNSQDGAISHLAFAAVRAAESLVYLAEIDAKRFNGDWPVDRYDNSVIDDAHVRWSASSALTSLDLSIAAASRLSDFKRGSDGHEDSVRDYVDSKGNFIEKPKFKYVIQPWRVWIETLAKDARYMTLLRVRNALVHADTYRNYFSGGSVHGHSMRCGYRIGPLTPTSQVPMYPQIQAREVIELSQDIAMTHVRAFADVLKALP